MTLRVRFARTGPDHHRLEAIRADGSVVVQRLETRGGLIHDLVHYAVESEAGLTRAFYGLLANGGDFEASAETWAGEAGEAEAVVGPLQSAVKSEIDVDAFVSRLAAMREDIGAKPISWLTPAVIARAVKRLRALEGRWRATPFGETMELEFPPKT